jgi:hypothetical protein
MQRLGQLADALSHSGLKPTAGSEARENLVDVLAAEYGARKLTPTYIAIVKEDGTIPVNPGWRSPHHGNRRSGVFIPK